MRVVLLLVLLSVSYNLKARQHWVVKKNLEAEWLVNDSARYTKYTADKTVTTVYVNVPVKQFRSDYFSFKSFNPVSVLLNNVLIADGVNTATLSIDSLAAVYKTEQLFFAFHREDFITGQNLVTQLVSKVLYQTRSVEQSYEKARTTFRDFAITAVLVLIIFLVSIIRLNPGLSADYFSVRKIFSRRESEDDHYYYRVTSGTILFYVFTSLLLALYWIIVLRFTDAAPGAKELTENSYAVLIFTWLKVSVYTLLFLFAKITVIYLISMLFGIREIAGYHFFNFVRILLVTIGLFSIVLLIYFIVHGQHQSFYRFLFAAIPWILGTWILVGFLKLASRVQHSAFHLFSYICATELIPFFIILAVLNK